MAYVANPGSNSASVLKVNEKTGVLTLMQTIRARAGAIDVAIVDGLEPTQLKAEHAFVIDKKSSALIAYSVDPETGKFSEQDRVTLGTSPTSIASNPHKPFIYVANKGSDELSGFILDPQTNKLRNIKVFPFKLNHSPSKLVIDEYGW